MKKSISVMLSLMLMILPFMMNASAENIEAGTPFRCEIYPERQEYQKGEEINICVSLENASLCEIKDMRIWMDYPETGYYLTPGVTERFVEFTDRSDMKMRVIEDAGVLKFASSFENTTVIRSFLLKLAHAYKTLTLAYATIRYSIQNAFVSVGQKKADLGTVKVIYDNTEIEFSVRCRYTAKESEACLPEKLSNGSGIAGAKITAVKNSYTGLLFAMGEDGKDYGLFAINPDYGKAFIYSVNDGKYKQIATKKVAVEAGKAYEMNVLFDSGRVVCRLEDNPHDTDPYPVFDLYYDSEGTGYGVYSGNNGYTDFNVTPGGFPVYDKTYVNPVYENAPDPFILKDDGIYYLYATTAPYGGFLVSSSTDLVNWQNLGYCAEKGEIFGNSDFWAPEVYKYQGKYYLLYSTDEHIALAVSGSPEGPFVKTSDGYLFEENCIDGHLLFDDDGSIYLYMAYWGKTGEEIWGCKMKPDLSSAVSGTLTQLTSCKRNEGGVNEGPFMLKYQGRYYLTYSVNGYTDHNYSVKLAVSDSPLGDYTGKGTILEKSGTIVGTGHHSFTTSPDGSELIIAYHCHYSTTRIHERKLCIDRCRFVQTSDGYTLSVYGPTSTSQPYPD